MSETAQRPYSKGEEICSSSVHGAGVLLGIAATAVLVTFAAINRDAWAVVGCAIFGASFIVLYAASTLYHAIPFERAKPILKKLDHIAIYYLIAGTYTPFLLTVIRGAYGWTIFGIIWALAIAGTVLKLCLKTNGAKLWSVALYLGMGWLSLMMIKPMLESMPPSGLLFLVLGGLAYTGGVFFYVKKSVAYTHSIWHFFVLLGTVLHFFSVLFSCAL